jgi:thioesterase domain-containing protein
MELLNDKKNKNIFAFPPISGYGLCYVQLSRLIDFYSLYAFDFIEDEDRIEQYVDLIINEQKEGPYTLVGYCIGGNLAFEVGKALESKGYEVADIILIDSDFLEEKEKDLAYYNELNNRIDNMVKNIKEFVSTNYPSMIEYVDKNIKRKINCYSNYEENIISEGVVNANLHNILSLSGELDKKIKLSNLWIKSTSKNLLIYKGFGTHNEMLNDGYVNENSEIIKDILSKNSTDKYLINKFSEREHR